MAGPPLYDPAHAVDRARLVAGHGAGEVELDVDVGVVADVEHDLDDFAPGELELGPVHAGDGVATVIAAAQPLSAEGKVAGHGAQLALGDDLVIDVELERPVGLL